MEMQIRAGEISEIIRKQTRGYEPNLLPALQPFKPLHTRHGHQRPHGRNKQEEHNLTV
jgi:hypothetical protein